MKLTDLTVTEFLAALRSSAPTPGGGSAAAAAGAMAASLLAMVAAMTKHRAPSAEDATRFRAAGDRCAAVAERLTMLVDEDSRAYDGVMAAFRLPKASDEEKTIRSAAIQEALTAAANTPLEVMKAALDAAENAVPIAEFGNPNAASDVGVALELLSAAQRGAAMNVAINLESLKDADYVRRVRGELATIAAECDRAVAAAKGYFA
jgi:methenyltetrahydrofolate cyclohydrolase